MGEYFFVYLKSNFLEDHYICQIMKVTILSILTILWIYKSYLFIPLREQAILCSISVSGFLLLLPLMTCE